LFRTLGNSFVVARIALAVAGALCSVITYLLARRVCSREVSIFAAVIATAAGTAFRFLVLHNCYSTLMACFALYAALRVIEETTLRWALATGSFATVTFLFEQSKGGGLALGLALGFALLHKKLRRSVVAVMLVGTVCPFALTAGYFARQHALRQMISSWFWPLRHYQTANHVPYGWQNWSDPSRDVIFRTGPWPARIAKVVAVSPGSLVPVLPLIAIGLLVYWAMRSGKQAENSRRPYYVIVCSALAGLLLSVVIVRSDILHFMYLAPLWYVVLAWILGAQPQASGLLAKARPALVAYTSAAFGMLGFAILLATTGAHNWIETRRGRLVTSEPDTVIPFVQAHIASGENFLVYPYLPLYNYLTATRSPAAYDFFQPGMNTTEQAKGFIASLVSTRTSAVLFEPWFAEKFATSWPETPIADIANDPIANYIVRDFKVCAMLHSPGGWRFQYMVKKNRPCPQ
jgi:hypothetical protein